MTALLRNWNDTMDRPAFSTHLPPDQPVVLSASCPKRGFLPSGLLIQPPSLPSVISTCLPFTTFGVLARQRYSCCLRISVRCCIIGGDTITKGLSPSACPLSTDTFPHAARQDTPSLFTDISHTGQALATLATSLHIARFLQRRRTFTRFYLRCR